MTFSNTVMLSNKADPWNSIPISRRNMFNSCLSIDVKSRPSYKISPESGRISPIIFLIRTVFPEPLRPIIRFVFPVSNTALMSFRTTRPSKDLVICFTSTIFYVSIKLVKITSASRIMILLITTAFVLALPTSSAPPFTL